MYVCIPEVVVEYFFVAAVVMYIYFCFTSLGLCSPPALGLLLCLAFPVSAGDLNSGPHVYIVSVFPLSQLPTPDDYLFDSVVFLSHFRTQTFLLDA